MYDAWELDTRAGVCGAERRERRNGTRSRINNRMSRLAGRTVCITGGSSGIGEACAREFAKIPGVKVIVTARRKDRLDKLKAELGENVYVLEMDVSKRQSVMDGFASLPVEFSKIDVLMANAGLALGLSSVETVSPEEVDTMIDTNIKGLLSTVQAVLPGMKQRGRGHIITVGSISATETYPNGSIYCGSKFFVRAFTRSLRQETAGTPIRVSEIDPGAVETEFSLVRYAGQADKAASVYSDMASLPLSAVDIAELVVFITSRPDHVVIAETLIVPSCQTQGSAMIAKK